MTEKEEEKVKHYHVEIGSTVCISATDRVEEKHKYYCCVQLGNTLDTECIAELTAAEYKFAERHIGEAVECGGCSQHGCPMCAVGAGRITEIYDVESEIEVNEDLVERILKKLHERIEEDEETPDE
jgi:predicted hydrocarbon binding protein